MPGYREVHVRRGHWHEQPIAPGSRFYLRLAPLQHPGALMSLMSTGSSVERFVPPNQVAIIRAASAGQTFFGYALSGTVTTGLVVEQQAADGPWELMLEGSPGELHLHGPADPPTVEELARVRSRLEALQARRAQPWGPTRIAV